MDNSQLLAQMMDPDEDVRAEASEALNLRMDDEVARGLLDIVAGDASEPVRADAVIALGPIIEEAGADYDEGLEFEFLPEYGPGISKETFQAIIGEIRAVYDDQGQPTLVRRRAFEVLVRDPQSWQVAEIRKHYASDDPQWKLTALFAMGYVSGFQAEIAATVESAQGMLLYEAVQAAGAKEVTAAAKRIGELATSEDADVDLRLAAIAALEYVHEDCLAILEELTESKDEEIVEAAEAALEELSMSEGWDEEE